MINEEGIITVDEKGVFQPDVINGLPYNQLRAWIKRVLWRREPGAGASRDDFPHGFLERVYRQLNPNVRDTFQDAILDHLNDMVKPPHANWLEDRGDELLLLVEAIFEDSFRHDAPVDLLHAMVKSKHFHQSDEVPNLHKRALETLISIRFQVDEIFWLEQYDIGGDIYASVVISGLVRLSLSKAFSWVKKHTRSDTVIEALFDKLPYMVEEYGEDRITDYLEELEPLLSDDQYSKFLQYAKWLKLELKPRGDEVHNFIQDMEGEELTDLVKNLKLTNLDHSLPHIMLKPKITEMLRYQANQSNLVDYGIETRGISEIIGIVELTRANNTVLSLHLKKKLDLYILKEKRKHPPQSDSSIFKYDSLRAMVMDAGDNPMNETKRICSF